MNRQNYDYRKGYIEALLWYFDNATKARDDLSPGEVRTLIRGMLNMLSDMHAPPAVPEDTQ